MPYGASDFYDPSNQLLQTEKQFQAQGDSERCAAIGGGGIANGRRYTEIASRHMRKATRIFLDGHVNSILFAILADSTDPFRYWKNPNDTYP